MRPVFPRDQVVPFIRGFLACESCDCGVSTTWFPTGMHLHLVPRDESQARELPRVLDRLLDLLPGWTGEVMPIGWTRGVE